MANPCTVASCLPGALPSLLHFIYSLDAQWRRVVLQSFTGALRRQMSTKVTKMVECSLME